MNEFYQLVTWLFYIIQICEIISGAFLTNLQQS